MSRKVLRGHRALGNFKDDRGSANAVGIYRKATLDLGDYRIRIVKAETRAAGLIESHSFLAELREMFRRDPFSGIHDRYEDGVIRLLDIH